jgi:hypothetical protein
MTTPRDVFRRACRTSRARTQRGVVTSAAQVTLVLVSLVVGGTALSLDEAREQVAEQTAHLHATYLLKASDALQTALDRALVDNNLSPARAAAVIDLDDTGVAGRIALFDASRGYGRRPRWPAGLLVEGIEGAGRPVWAEEAARVVEVPGIDLAVCRRFNEKVQGARANETPPADLAAAQRGLGWQQGCWAGEGASSGTWFTTAFATADCLGVSCRSRDEVGESARRMMARLEAAPIPGVVDPAAGPATSRDDDAPDSADLAWEADADDPIASLVECASREAAAGERDPELVAARCAGGA